jgi:hypothetical protein
LGGAQPAKAGTTNAGPIKFIASKLDSRPWDSPNVSSY